MCGSYDETLRLLFPLDRLKLPLLSWFDSLVMGMWGLAALGFLEEGLPPPFIRN